MDQKSSVNSSLLKLTDDIVINVVQVFLLFPLNIFIPFSSVSIFDFEQVNVS